MDCKLPTGEISIERPSTPTVTSLSLAEMKAALTETEPTPRSFRKQDWSPPGRHVVACLG